MNRTTRSVALTAAARLLLARAGPAGDRYRRGAGSGARLREVPSGTLRINAPPRRRPRAGADGRVVLRAHPQIELEIAADTFVIRHVGAGFDAGVRYGSILSHRTMIAVSLDRRSVTPWWRHRNIRCAAWSAETLRRICSITLHPHPLRQRR